MDEEKNKCMCGAECEVCGENAAEDATCTCAEDCTCEACGMKKVA